ncbi:Arrestin-C [Oryzias melastigma]|uniref:Arrestin-C n=1 Tax=Oryzias melastigma TaxID=30732 RepID=A0A834CA59_ORYME|nr:Arrestin-C [Oryzias melastigma]
MAKVFKKTSGNGTIALYLGKRDFVDCVDSVEVVDGVVKVDPAGLNGKKVFVYLACAFRYGSDDLDVIGLNFRRDIWIKRVQACGVDFEVKAYIANELDNPDEVIEKKNTCRLIIRKIQFAPASNKAGPKAEISKQFMMTDKPVNVEISLEKEIYYHGDPITVNVKINNETTKTVKKIKVSVDQQTSVVLYSSDTYTKEVCAQEFGETVGANSTFEKSFQVMPLLANNKEKKGLAVDGRLKDEDTNLASTTLGQGEREMQGILISYKVKVAVTVSGGGMLGGLTGSDVVVEVPLTLMSPKPAEVTDVNMEPAEG